MPQTAGYGQGATGLSAAGDRLRAIVAQREHDALAAEQEQYQRQQDAAGMALKGRQVGADETRAQADLFSATHPKMAAPSISVVRGLRSDTAGKPIPVVQGIEEGTGRVVWEKEEAPPLTAPKTANSQESKFLLDGKPVQGDYLPGVGESGRYFFQGQEVTGRAKPIPPASSQVNVGPSLTDAALDMDARRYLAGDTVQFGYGAAGDAKRTAVKNRAAELDPNAALAANKADYKADTSNLTNLRRIESTLTAFEATAGKNLDQFLNLAKNIPDSGIPWLNTPIRAVTGGVGSEHIAAFNAARNVALREIARVTNDPKLAGALTDHARAEVEALSPENATFAQIRAVAKVLKQDMANVHTGLTEEIERVNTRLRGMGQTGGSDRQNAPDALPAGKLGVVNGQRAVWDGHGWIPASEWTGPTIK